jgi:hypothetical protein
MTISDMSANKFNVILDHELATGGILTNAKWTFNNNTSSVYAYRHSISSNLSALGTD